MWKALTFPTNKFLLAAEVDGLDSAKKSSGFVGIVGIDWVGRLGNIEPMLNVMVKSAILDGR